MRARLQDAPDNATRFLLIGPSDAACQPSEADKTSLLVVLRDEPGSLYAALRPLSEASINLTRIESRPSRRRAWQYVFFLELEGHASSAPIRDALNAMGDSSIAKGPSVLPTPRWAASWRCPRWTGASN